MDQEDAIEIRMVERVSDDDPDNSEYSKNVTDDDADAGKTKKVTHKIATRRYLTDETLSTTQSSSDEDFLGGMRTDNECKTLS